MADTSTLNGFHSRVMELPADERPRERLALYGAGTLQTAELIAIILRTGTSRENAIEMASRLLREHGGLGGLITVDFAQLCQEHGLGTAKAAQLKSALEIGRRVSLLDVVAKPKVARPEDVANLVMLEMAYLAQEQLRVLCLDTKHFVMAQHIVYSGTVNSSVVRAAEVFRHAIARTSTAIIVVHNHPSGDPTPSPEDIRTTEQLRGAGELLDIELLDHVIIGKQRFVSLKERGLGF